MVHTSWATGKDHTECPKSLSSKAEASEETRRTPRYDEPLSDARTLHGKRRGSARQGWAGEKSDFFSILLVEPHMGSQLVIVECRMTYAPDSRVVAFHVGNQGGHLLATCC